MRPTYCHKEVTTVPMTTIEVQYSSKFWSKIELYIVEGHGILSWFNLTTAVVSRHGSTLQAKKYLLGTHKQLQQCRN